MPNSNTTVANSAGRLRLQTTNTAAVSMEKTYALTSGKHYRVSFDADAATYTNVNVEIVGYNNTALSSATLNTGVTHYELDFVANDVNTVIKVSLGTGTGTRVIYLDNVKLEEIKGDVNGHFAGFNGKEKDNETFGEGNSINFGARIYDSRLGRWLKTDPFLKEYPGISPYCFGLNNPLFFVDIDGNIIIDKNGNVVTIARGEDGNITGITIVNKKGETVAPDPFTVKMITAIDKTEIGRQRLAEMSASHNKYVYRKNNGSKTGYGPAVTYTKEKKGIKTYNMYINTKYQTQTPDSRFAGASEEEYLNATGVHEPSHYLNADQVILNQTQIGAEKDRNSEYVKSGFSDKFQYENFETAVLKDELLTREQFKGNTLDHKVEGDNRTSRDRYNDAINAPKSTDVKKYKPKN